MKLLFDENLSPKLPGLLVAKFPGSQHVRELGLKGRTDEEIWRYAGDNGFAIVSKDKDFSRAPCCSVRRLNSSGWVWAIAPAPTCWH